jgi:four helix bundle protein
MNPTLSRSHQLAQRTRRFALEIVRGHGALKAKPTARVIADQLLRSATGLAANYRAAQRARSRREFAARIGICVEEADESLFWIELLVEAGLLSSERGAPLVDEARQLTAIFTAAHRTARRPLQVHARPSRAADARAPDSLQPS